MSLKYSDCIGNCDRQKSEEDWNVTCASFCSEEKLSGTWPSIVIGEEALDEEKFSS